MSRRLPVLHWSSHVDLRPGRRELAPRLLPWFDAHRRDLPWRRTHDPYRLLVSEVMLQQTQVTASCPTPAPSCAPSPPAARCAGAAGGGAAALGRPRLLRPRPPPRRVPGQSSPTTAGGSTGLRQRSPGCRRRPLHGAVLGVAFGQRHPAVDANVRRVLSHVLFERGNTAASSTRVTRFAEQAVPPPGRELPTRLSWKWARCSACPRPSLSRVPAPERPHADRPDRRRLACPCTCTAPRSSCRWPSPWWCGGATYLLAQRPPRGRWGGLWSFPQREVDAAKRSTHRARRPRG